MVWFLLIRTHSLMGDSSCRVGEDVERGVRTLAPVLRQLVRTTLLAVGNANAVSTIARMPPKRDYRISRQRHLGTMLDELQNVGLLDWEWEYDSARSRATYLIAVGDGERRTYETKPAEDLVMQLCQEHGLIWEPVRHPGGRKQLEEALARMAERRRGL